MMLQCLIVDDEDTYLELLGHLVEAHPSLELAGVFRESIDARDYLAENRVDLVFLDIEMPGISGLDLLMTAKHVPQVIFITAHSQYAAEAFDCDVTDYIVKPVDEQRFKKAVSRALAKSRYQDLVAEQENIYVRADAGTVRIRMLDITSIESLGDYITIYEGGRKHTVLGSLNGAQNTLSKDSFMRIHRKYLVRLNAIDRIDDSRVYLNDGNVFQVSRANRSKLSSRIKAQTIKR